MLLDGYRTCAQVTRGAAARLNPRTGDTIPVRLTADARLLPSGVR
jgi:hypothetical protein